MQNDERFMRRKQMARYLGVSERHLSDLVARRIIPCLRLGHRTVLFDPAKVERALERFEQREIGREVDYE